jgi:HlyD family secretion protein
MPAPTAIPIAAPSRHLRHPALLAGLGVLALAMSLLYAWRHASKAPPQFATTPVTRGSVVQSVSSSGSVNPVTTVQVGSYVSGVILQVLCDFNTPVKAHQLCARIDARPYQMQVAQEEAALATADAQLQKDEANLELARRTDARNTELLNQGFLSQEAADNAHNGLAQARAQLALDRASIAQHQAQLQAARINLSYTDITSPVEGTVVARNVTQGQTVAASFQTPTLFLIATDLTRMQVDTNVSESDIGHITVGAPASFTVSAFPERRFRGSVQQIRQAPQTVQNVVTYDVVVDVENADLALKPGMTAAISIETGRADNVLRVPDQSLRYRPSSGAGQQVWVLQNGRPQPVPVRTGLDDDSFSAVTQGALHEGDQVILTETAARASKAAAPSAAPATAPLATRRY